MTEKENKLQTVQKRDGDIVPFNIEAIEMAISNAAAEVGEILDAEELAQKVVKRLKGDSSTVEEIQDSVTHVLLASKYKATGEAFVRYRAKRDQVRDEKCSWAKLGIDITSGGDTESQRENSNVPRNSVTTQIEMIKRLYTKKFAMDFILPKRFKDAHESGEIHVHDASDLVTKVPNCCLMHYPYMLEKGFQLGNKWIEEPTTILTTMNVLVQMVQVQSNLQFGGLTLQDMDIHLGKYILGSFKKYLEDAVEDLGGDKKDLSAYQTHHPLDEVLVADFPKEVEIAKRKTEREVYKSCKLLGYQLNTLQIRGESSPFVTVSYGLSTTWEGRLFQKCILQERLDEFNKSGVTEFPKHMMNIREGINLRETDTNHDIFNLAVKTSAKTCYPDYIFPENQELHTGGSATYMG